MADEMSVGLARRLERQAALGHERRQRAVGPIGAEIARDCRLEFARGRRGAPQPERLGLGGRRAADEHIGLQALDRIGLAAQ